jgi:hypothetical protein
MKTNLAKILLLATSSLSILATACTVDGSQSASTGDDEATATTSSALWIQDYAVRQPGRMDLVRDFMPLVFDQRCPPDDNFAVSVPATRDEVRCKAKPGRCFRPVPPDVCDHQNNLARTNGAINQEAFDWLQANGYCAFSLDREVGAICQKGCFEATTAILTGVDGEEAIWTPAEKIGKGTPILSLRDDAKLDAPVFESRQVLGASSGPEEPLLFVFRLSNGHSLKVTQHHPMVLSDGRVISAQNVKATDTFLDLDGAKVTILGIEREKTESNVYNFSVDAETQTGHVLGAEGVLVGDLKLQHDVEREELEINSRK